jgi:hypothetical protein
LALKKAQQPKSGEHDGAEQPTDDLDILADDGVDADEGDGGGAPVEVRPIGPPENATDQQVAEWRAEHGVPDEPDGYEPPAVEGIQWDADALNPILEIAHGHNLPKQAVADALAAYAERIQEQRAEIKRLDAENAKAVRSTFSEAEIAAVKAAAKAMPGELRTMLNTARLPDGSRLVNQPEVLRMIAASYGAKGEHQPQPRDRTTMLKAELQELHALRDRDIGEYWKPWKGTGKSGADRALELTRQLSGEATGKPSEGDLQSEARALRNLRVSDPEMFAFGSWKGTGRPGADRLAAIESGRG